MISTRSRLAVHLVTKGQDRQGRACADLEQLLRLAFTPFAPSITITAAFPPPLSVRRFIFGKVRVPGVSTRLKNGSSWPLFTKSNDMADAETESRGLFSIRHKFRPVCGRGLALQRTCPPFGSPHRTAGILSVSVVFPAFAVEEGSQRCDARAISAAKRRFEGVSNHGLAYIHARTHAQGCLDFQAVGGISWGRRSENRVL